MPDDLLDRLRGGDLRSLGRASDVVAVLEASPARFPEVVDGLHDTGPVVRARAADVIEKVTRTRPALLAPFKRRLIALLGTAEQQALRWHLAQMAPRLVLTARQREVVISALRRYLVADGRIVRVAALDALVAISRHDDRLRREVRDIVLAQIGAGSPAVRARGRKLLRSLH